MATVVMTDAMLTGRERRAVRDDVAAWNGIAHSELEGMRDPSFQLGWNGSGR